MSADLPDLFPAVRLDLDNARWAGVPFHVRAGKCLPVACADALVALNPPASTS